MGTLSPTGGDSPMKGGFSEWVRAEPKQIPGLGEKNQLEPSSDRRQLELIFI